MVDDPFKKFQFKETPLERATRQLQPLQRAFENQERLAQIVDPYRGMFEEATHAGQLAEKAFVRNDTSDLIAQAFIAKATFEDLTQQICLPEIEAFTNLQEIFEQPHILDALNRYGLVQDTITQAIADMESPWLDLHNQLGSFSALTELHGIGHVLATMPGFDDHVAAALRFDLGDWREPLRFDLPTLLDPIARNELYIAQGYDPGLAAFPVPAFRDGLTSAGLYDVESEPVEEPADGEKVEDAFMRTNEAHDRLMRFEYRLRIFIDEAMTRIAGPEWAKHRVSEKMHSDWIHKRDSSLAKGEAEQPLIAYADFTDYVEIIIRKDNWRDVFGEIFSHKPSVEESFRRLFPVRICTMHARLITQDDALFLLVEVKRLSKAIGIEL